jgi:hypothetical protein
MANHYLVPGEEDDPLHTMFSITNGGNYALSDHQIICNANLIVGNDGTSVEAGVASTIENGQRKFGGLEEARKYHTTVASPLLPNGDSETIPCMNYIVFGNLQCADITLIFDYWLETQPESRQEKKFRFVAEKGKHDAFSWYTQPILRSDSYCLPYYKPRPRQP